MFTISEVKRHVNRLKNGQILTTRELLSYGTRSAVDQAVCALVKDGYMDRLARGVFVTTKSWPAVKVKDIDVATAKARAFGKELLTDAAHIAGKLGIAADMGSPPNTVTFASSGCSSQFRFGDITIRFRGICQRKFQLGETKSGQSLRALWHIGQRTVNAHTVQEAARNFLRTDREEIRRPCTAGMLPEWLKDFFAVVWHIEKHKSKAEREAIRHAQQVSDRRWRQTGLWELKEQLGYGKSNADQSDPPGHT